MRKIGIFIPVFFDIGGGTLRLAKTLAKAIQTEAKRVGDDIRVVFGNTEGRYRVEDLQDLVDLEIEIREFQLKTLTRRKAARHLQRLPGDLIGGTRYCIPQGGKDDFLDCSLWIFISDRIYDVLLPLVKTAIFATDYIQRVTSRPSSTLASMAIRLRQIENDPAENAPQCGLPDGLVTIDVSGRSNVCWTS